MPENDKRREIFERLTRVFRNVFDDDVLVLTENLSAADVDAWDSLMHITLCITVENEFNIRLNPSEIANLANVGKMVDFLSERI